MSWKPSKPFFADFKKSVFQKAGEVSEFIYQIGEDPILRKPSKEVPIKDIKSADFKAKVKYLKECLIKIP